MVWWWIDWYGEVTNYDNRVLELGTTLDCCRCRETFREIQQPTGGNTFSNSQKYKLSLVEIYG